MKGCPAVGIPRIHLGTRLQQDVNDGRIPGGLRRHVEGSDSVVIAGVHVGKSFQQSRDERLALEPDCVVQRRMAAVGLRIGIGARFQQSGHEP